MSNKFIAFIVFVAMVIGVSGSLYAGCGQNMGGDCSNCMKSSAMSDAPVAMTDPWRKFQSDTIDLRQEMMIKRFELQRENLKSTQDQNKVVQLKTEIKSLQTKIHEIRAKSQLPDDKFDGECGGDARNCGGKGMGGCNGSPCNSGK